MPTTLAASLATSSWLVTAVMLVACTVDIDSECHFESQVCGVGRSCMRYSGQLLCVPAVGADGGGQDGGGGVDGGQGSVDGGASPDGAAPDAGWAGDGGPAPDGGSMDDGGSSSDGGSSLDGGTTADGGCVPEWHALSLARSQAPMAYDAASDRFYVFGGRGLSALKDDLWVRQGPNGPWTPIAVSGPRPAARAQHSLVFDSANGRLIVFGGFDANGDQRKDVWAFSVAQGTWSELTPTGQVPTRRSAQAAIYDSANQQMIVFGGPVDPLSGLWSLSLPPDGGARWSQLTLDGGPGLVISPAAVYSSDELRMIVFGGRGSSVGSGSAAVWSLSLPPDGGAPAWSYVSSNLALDPSTCIEAAAAYVPSPPRLYVVGPQFLPDAGVNRGVLYLPLDDASPSWASLPLQQPGPSSSGGSMVYASAAGQSELVFFGGVIASTPSTPSGPTGDTYRVNLDAGASPIGWYGEHHLTPEARFAAVAVFDPGNQRLLLEGGNTGTASVLPDLWSYSDSADWSDYYEGNEPTDGKGVAAAWAGAKGMVIFGFFSTPDNVNQTWQITTTPYGWTQLADTGSALTIRTRHSMIYDEHNDRLVVFGGEVPDGGTFGTNDLLFGTIADGGVSWQQVAIDGGPSPRYMHSAIYDSTRGQMVIFGGLNGGPSPLPDVHALVLDGTPRWAALPSDTIPRAGHVAVYDATTNRMIVFGGYGDQAPPLGDVRSLSLAENPPTWSDVGTVGSVGRTNPAGTFDPSRRRLLVFGGHVLGPLNDLLELVLCPP
jgi:hypothetical protein